jgi:hypothetical protein
MRNASGHSNVHAGTVSWFTIKATGVNLKVCQQSWSLDRAEGEAGNLRESSGLAAVVTGESSFALRTAVDKCNIYLIGELGYKRQFDRYEVDSDYLAYLWGEPAEGRVAVYGACCFRNRNYEKGAQYAMQWIWIHPYARRKGHLAGAWPYFRTRFGAFLVEPPLSDGMKRFLVARKDYNEALAAHGFKTTGGAS